jgi:hypothetical protein
MAQLSKDTLKSIFKAGNIPSESDFASLIESNLNLIDTGSLILSASALNISGASIGKTDIDRLRDGRGLTATSSLVSGSTGDDQDFASFLRPEAIFSTTDDSTYQKFTIAARVGQFVSGNLFFDQNLSGSNNYIALGKANTADTQFRFSGNITASGNISASGNIITNTITSSHTLITSEHPKLTIKSNTANGDPTLQFKSGDGSTMATIRCDVTNNVMNQLSIGSGTNETHLVLDANGKIGIGLNTPGEQLTVTGNISSSGTLTAEDVIVADDLSLTSDSSIFNMGAGNDFSITHDGTTGATIRATPLTLTSVGAAVLAATGTVTLSAVADIILDSDQDIRLDAAGGNIEFKDSGTTQLTLDMDGTAGAQVIQLGVNGDDLVFKQFDGTTVFTIGDDQIAYVEEDLKVGDDIWLSSNGGKISFGSDFDNVSLTHVLDTGLLLGGTKKLQFNDASQFIHAPSATVLDIAATDEIELTATLIDVVGNLNVSGILTADFQSDLTPTLSTQTANFTAAVGHEYIVNKADGAAIVLPAAAVGYRITILIGTLITSNTTTITAASGDLLKGYAFLEATDAANNKTMFNPDGSDDLIITLNGSTKGGLVGDRIELVGISATEWRVRATLSHTGTAATPFS